MHSLVRALALCALFLARPALAAAAADCPPATPAFTPALFSDAAKHARDRGLLWKISKSDRVSYLYGTFHLGKAEWMAPGPGVRRALAETDVIALEIDPLDPSVQLQLSSATASLKRNLSAHLRQRLKAAWDAQCLPPGALDAGASEMSVIALMMAFGMREGLNPAYGSEILLSLIGQGASRTVVSLETVALQLAALLAKDDAEAESFIGDSLDDLERGKLRGVLAKTAQAWEQGDLVLLESYPDWCACIETESERKFMKRVLTDRNPGLAERIDQLHMQGKRVFAAAGALHMVGLTGLPAALAERGYRVERLH